MAIGCVLLWREVLEKELFQEKPFCAFGAWLWLIMEANWEDKKDRYGEVVKRGEIHTSQRALASAWGWERSKVRRFLDRLERDQRIDQQTTQERTKIRLTNYELYQDFNLGRGPQKAQHPTRHPTQQPTLTEQRSTKQRNNEVLLYSFPAELSDEECQRAWTLFVDHRKKIRKPLSPQTQQIQLAAWAAKGKEAFLAAVEYTVGGGWQKLVEKGTYDSPKGTPKDFGQLKAESKAQREAEAVRIAVERGKLMDEYLETPAPKRLPGGQHGTR